MTPPPRPSVDGFTDIHEMHGCVIEAFEEICEWIERAESAAWGRKSPDPSWAAEWAEVATIASHVRAAQKAIEERRASTQ